MADTDRPEGPALTPSAISESTPGSAQPGGHAVLPLLEAAVTVLGGTPRPGQQQMADAVARALDGQRHLLVQAGTGTGKSLAYLVPAVEHAMRTHFPVIISTATLALQAQIVDRDLPRVAQALTPLLGRRPTWQLLKGRNNYLCRNKLQGGYPTDDHDELFEFEPAGGGGSSSALGREVVRLREWGVETTSGDRDELVPGVSDRAWRQVSVTAHECLGQRCPVVAECHSELARARAREVDVVVSNHAFVAIDSFEGRAMLPEHDALILDEGHELADRVTSVITDELTEGVVSAAASRARRLRVEGSHQLEAAAIALGEALAGCEPGRIEGEPPPALVLAVAAVRDTARSLLSAMSSERGKDDASKHLAKVALTEVHDVAERIGAISTTGEGFEVLWVSSSPGRPGSAEPRLSLHIAPLSVAGLLRERMFGDRTVVLTSATLTIGGTFDSAAGALGLRGEGAPDYDSLDVGSPFDYPRQGMLYVAAHLPPPGRDGPSEAMYDELAELITAAGGRTLGLFSSRKAAELAAEAMRDRLDVPILCQGDDGMATLVREFASDVKTCLFGTMSLWQGVDVPGTACQLVVIDRIPFPRPDDPLASARARAVAKAGGNGFMAVSAVHAALRLAQGVGRLVRTSQDRGAVAILDSRMASARYSSFLRASLPPLWATTDKETVLAALRRIDESAGEPVAVAAPAARGLTSSAR